MAAPMLWGSKLSVNTTAQGNQIAPSLQALKNGSYLAVWEDMTDHGGDKSGGGIYGQFFNADGTKKGGEFLINSTTFGRQIDPKVVELTDGRVVVVWLDEGAGSVIRARCFGADGTPLGQDVQVNATPAAGTGEFSVTALSNGGYAVAYITLDLDVRVRSFAASLDPKTEILVEGHAQDFFQAPEIVAHEGGYTVFYGRSTVEDLLVHNRTYNNDGTLATGTLDFIEPHQDTKYSQVTAAHTGGLSAVAWVEDSHDGENYSTTIKVQLLKPDSSKHGAEITVASSRDEFLHEPEITHLADGGFAVAYYKSVPGQPPSSSLMDIYLAPFDGQGNRLGPDLLVERLQASILIKSLVTLADGRTVVSWTSDQGANSPSGQEIHARIVDPRQKAVSLNGTSHDDQYIGTRFHDTLNGGAGADTLTGAEGNDTFYVDDARDGVKESAGQGIDTVIASTSYRLDLAAEVEVLKLASAGRRSACTLEGSNSANAISGHAGANTLKGHGGNDKLYGGAGKDVLSGGAGRDVFVFDAKPNKTTNVDRIADFSVRDDSVYLDNAVFTKLGSGTLSKPKKFKSDMSVKSNKAQDAEDRIVYDRKTGALYYAKDGTGSAARVKIATLTTKANLTHNDFFVI